MLLGSVVLKFHDLELSVTSAIVGLLTLYFVGERDLWLQIVAYRYINKLL